jgi:hypothetical protein
MPDPVTIGTFVVSVFTKAVEAGVGVLAKSTTKDAYEALKGKLSQWAGREVATLEVAPDSDKTRRTVTEIIDRQPEQELAALRILAKALIDELRKSGTAVALDLSGFRNVEVDLENIGAKAGGVGVRVNEMEGGKFKAKGVSAEGN